MFKTLVLLSAINGLISCLQLTGVSYTPCPEIPNTIQSIDVTPCDAEPCAFKRGTQVRIQAIFKPNQASNNCKLNMVANLGGWVPIVDEDVCGSVPCPLTPGSNNLLDYTILVGEALPAGLTQTKWRLNCDSGATEVFCADVSVNVV